MENLISGLNASGNINIEDLENASAASSNGFMGFDPLSLTIMFVMSVVGYGYWRYWRSSDEQKYLYVAIFLMAFPYVSSDPAIMIGGSIGSIVIAHFVID